ncbi:MAG: acylphosphatase [Candidatus Margulisiibacteriota bacterium]
MIRKHIFISGLVQGICFRMYTQRQAGSLGVKGWVKNLPDGRVEAIFEGHQSDVDKLIIWCNLGPPYAEVDNIETHKEDYTGEFDNFSIRY